MKDDKTKIKKELSPEDRERLELLQASHQKTGMQLSIDTERGDIKWVDEIKEIVGKNLENPDEKYNIYYNIRSVLMKFLPKGKANEEGRRLIYDEVNIFLNRGKKKSDGQGKRGSDGRMTYQENMDQMLDSILKWVSESKTPIDLFNMLYELNTKLGYGHENYDETSVSFARAMEKISKASKPE